MTRSTPRSGAPGSFVPPHRFSAANGALVATLLIAVALVPLWSVDIPPLMDCHNHLAGQYIRKRPASLSITHNFSFCVNSLLNFLAAVSRM